MVMKTSGVRRTASIMALMLFVSVLAMANDSEFHGYGGILSPVKNSTIRMVREDLDVKYLDSIRRFRVSVDYVFVNEGPATSITVGFVCPPTFADYDQPDIEFSPIDDHVVTVNGRSLNVEHIKMDSSGVVKGLHVDAGDHVYLFTARFKKGRNIVSHRYTNLASNDLRRYQNFTYVLKTGGNWAKGKIDTFNLTIDMGKPNNDTFVFLPLELSSSKKRSSWSLDSHTVRVDTLCSSVLFTYSGEESLEKKELPLQDCPGDEFLVLRNSNGIIRYSEIDFIPDRNIDVGYLFGL